MKTTNEYVMSWQDLMNGIVKILKSSIKSNKTDKYSSPPFSPIVMIRTIKMYDSPLSSPTVMVRTIKKYDSPPSSPYCDGQDHKKVWRMP